MMYARLLHAIFVPFLLAQTCVSVEYSSGGIQRGTSTTSTVLGTAAAVEEKMLSHMVHTERKWDGPQPPPGPPPRPSRKGAEGEADFWGEDDDFWEVFINCTDHKDFRNCTDDYPDVDWPDDDLWYHFYTNQTYDDYPNDDDYRHHHRDGDDLHYYDGDDDGDNLLDFDGNFTGNFTWDWGNHTFDDDTWDIFGLVVSSEQQYLESVCSILDVYDNAVRYNRPNADKSTWTELCEEFEPVDFLFCPDDEVVDIFCQDAMYKPHLNPTVRHNYCVGYFEEMNDDTRRQECVNHCVNYVSRDRGNCCDWDCPPEAA